MRQPALTNSTSRRRAALVALTFVALLFGFGALALTKERESERLIDLLGLEAAMTAADVGAGEGRFTEAFARAVGSAGRVYATEVEADLVDTLATEMRESGLSHVTTVLGDQAQTGLPEACCNAILVRMVYHHFENPAAMRRSLRDALKPGGLLAIVDINPQRHWRHLKEVPDRGGHGIEPQDLVSEMVSGGFELVSLHNDWNGDDDRYCAVFRIADTSTAASQ